MVVHTSNVSGIPTASIATFAPRAVGQFQNAFPDVLPRAVDRLVGAERDRPFEPRL